MGRYRVYVFPQAWKEVKGLPGYVRHRIRKSVERLAGDPWPAKSKSLTFPEATQDLRRLRLESWRILYAVDKEEKLVVVLGVRKRPPYNYEDLAELVSLLT